MIQPCYNPIPNPFHPKRLLLPGERGFEEAYRTAGLVNGGMVNSGHGLVDGGVIRAHVAGEPDPFGSPDNRWTASAAVTASPLYQNVAGSTPVTADGDVVGSWRSSHGSATLLTAQSDDTKRGTYKTNIVNGHPVVRFVRASSQNLFATLTRNQPRTLFIVASFIGLNTNFLVDGRGAGANQPSLINETAVHQIDAYAGGAAVASVTVAGDNVFFIICAIFNGASSQIRLNAGSAVTANIGANNAGGITLAGRKDNAAFLSCDIAEVVDYNTALSTSDEQSERNILNAWYAVF